MEYSPCNGGVKVKMGGLRDCAPGSTLELGNVSAQSQRGAALEHRAMAYEPGTERRESL